MQFVKHAFLALTSYRQYGDACGTEELAVPFQNERKVFITMKLKDIMHTKKEIEDMGHSIENNIIKGIDISVIGHFGNCVSLDVWCNNCSIYHDHNDTKTLGFLIKSLIELFDLTEEDGYRVFSQFNDIPIRIICEGNVGWGSKVIGFGNFMKDEFVLKEDFCKIDE